MKIKQLLSAAIGASLLFAGALWAQPFGGSDDVAYAKKLWRAMQSAGLFSQLIILCEPGYQTIAQYGDGRKEQQRSRYVYQHTIAERSLQSVAVSGTRNATDDQLRAIADGELQSEKKGKDGGCDAQCRQRNFAQRRDQQRVYDQHGLHQQRIEGQGPGK